MPLSGCAPRLAALPDNPAQVADQTTADERGGIAIESLYTLGARTGALAFRAGLVALPQQAETRQADFCGLVAVGSFRATDRGAELMVLECRLRALRDAGRAAYDAGNAASYEQLLARAAAIADLIAAFAR